MKPPLLLGTAFAVLALVTLLGTTDSVRAQTFNPSLSINLVDPQAGAHSDFEIDFNLPEGDLQFAAVISFIPGEWDITPGDEIPIGAIVGELSSLATLGLINAQCDNGLQVQFTFLNSSIDVDDTVSFVDTFEDTDGDGVDDNSDEDFTEDKDDSGLPDAFEKYPDFITRVLDDEPGDEVGQPLQPIRRSAGITIVAGVSVLLQFLIFEPGTFIDELISNDPELGYPTVLLLQNIGDPDEDPIPGPITDFCSPLTSSNTTFGVSKDNPCTADVPVETLDPLCEVTGTEFEIPEEGITDPDESGIPLFTNPEEGTYTFTIITAGQRDADGDGYENTLDTCPFDINVGNPRIKGDGDDDFDGLDAACDPNSIFAEGGTNSDEDLDGFTNRQDNCPLVPNGELEDNQRDTDDDTIGDACDPNPDNADTEGELTFVVLTEELIVGPGGEPAEDETPTDGDTTTPSEDDDGGSGALVIIIVVVVAAVVVVGGGAFYFMRRSG